MTLEHIQASSSHIFRAMYMLYFTLNKHATSSTNTTKKLSNINLRHLGYLFFLVDTHHGHKVPLSFLAVENARNLKMNVVVLYYFSFLWGW